MKKLSAPAAYYRNCRRTPLTIGLDLRTAPVATVFFRLRWIRSTRLR